MREVIMRNADGGGGHATCDGGKTSEGETCDGGGGRLVRGGKTCDGGGEDMRRGGRQAAFGTSTRHAKT